MLDQYIESLKGDKNFFIGEDIPEKKLRGAASSYAENFDECIILYDDTVFGSAKEGFLLTKTHFSCKTNNLDKFQIRLGDIKKIEYKKALLSANIYINDIKVAECIQAKKESISDFCSLLQLTIEDFKNTAHTPQNPDAHAIHRKTTENKKAKPPLMGKMFIKNIAKPPSADEIFEAIILNIENNKTAEAEKLCIYFIETSAQAVCIFSNHHEFCAPNIVKEFASELVKKLSTKTIEHPGFLIGIILLYRAAFFMDSTQIAVQESILKAATYFKLGVANEHPASCFYLAEILEKYPKLAHELEINIEPSTLYWMGAIHKHPLALAHVADKYLSTDMELGMFFHRLAAENGNIDSYETLNGDNIGLRLL